MVGGLFGQGFNVSNLLVPVRESDMIFTVVAEDFGFVGALVLLILYVSLIYRILKITLQSNNQFYTYISIGFIMMPVSYTHLLLNGHKQMGNDRSDEPFQDS